MCNDKIRTVYIHLLVEDTYSTTTYISVSVLESPFTVCLRIKIKSFKAFKLNYGRITFSQRLRCKRIA